MDTAFRKIDIDIYDEDARQDCELYEIREVLQKCWN